MNNLFDNILILNIFVLYSRVLKLLHKCVIFLKLEYFICSITFEFFLYCASSKSKN